MCENNRLKSRLVTFLIASSLAWCGLSAHAAAQTAPGGLGTGVPPAGQPTAPPTPPPSLEAPPASPPPDLGRPLAPPPGRVLPPPPTRRLNAFHLNADRIAFYSNRYVIGADGRVRVKLGDGTLLTGDTFSMDLRLNRFLIAGNVTLLPPHAPAPLAGAAFAEFFDFDRAYFIPISGGPDRWTYAFGDYAHPLLGREMPGDAFLLPNLAGNRVFLYSKSANVDPRRSVRFAPADINFGLTFLPFPTYFLNFSPNPNFAQNALPGATVDGPLDFAGGEHGLATAHIRYDTLNKVFFAYEQHQVSDFHYAVFSVSPLTRPLKQYNLLGYDHLAPKTDAGFAFQESAFQSDFHTPLSATAYTNARIARALPHSFMLVNFDQFYFSLLAQPQPGVLGLLYYGDPTHNWVPNHPSDLTLSWIGFRNRIFKTPLYLAWRSQESVYHDGYNIFTNLFGVNYPTIWAKSGGVDVVTSPIVVLKDRKNRLRDVVFTAYFDKQRTYFSVPHHFDATITGLALSKTVVPGKFVVFTSYSNLTTGDYWGAVQSIIYPPYPAYDFANNTFDLTHEAFRGFATQRSFNQNFVCTPTATLAFSGGMRENKDFPKPVPGPLVSAYGTVYFNNYGYTPFQAYGNVRYRVNRLWVLDITRSYFFHFGGFQNWSQQFNFQVLR